MTINQNLPYRQGVVAIIQDSEGNYLIVQSVKFKDNEWKFPSGGIEGSESPIEALRRELMEEMGTDKFEVIKQSEIVNRFEWPEELQIKYRGQEQIQFFVKFIGNKGDIKPDPEEIKNIKWVKYEELEKHFVFPNQWNMALRTIMLFKLQSL